MVSITQAIVLRLVDYGESDRIVTLLTAEQGKISAIAKGARRSRKRFGGALCLFGYGEATLRERRGNELWILEELHSAKGFSRLPQEIGRFGQASYACELCRELCPTHQAETEIFFLLYSFLEHLNQLPLDTKPRVETLLLFEFNLLRLIGLQLSISHCAVCGCEIGSVQKEDVEKQLPMDIERGGTLCNSCLSGDIDSLRMIRWLSRSVYEALFQLENQDFESSKLEPLHFTREVLKICREILLEFIHHHLGKKLQVIDFIYQMNHFE